MGRGTRPGGAQSHPFCFLRSKLKTAFEPELI